MTLLAHWPLTETGATFSDVSGNGFHFDVSGFDASNIGKGYTAAGRTGAYMHLRADGDVCPQVATSDARLNLNDSWTIEAWVLWPSTHRAAWPATHPFSDFPGILAFGGHESNFDDSRGWMFFYSEHDEPFQMYPDTYVPYGAIVKRNAVNVTNNGKTLDDVWYHLAIGYDATTSTWTSRKNDSDDGTGSWAIPDSASSILRLGSNPNYGYHQKARCVISDLKVWSDPLPPSSGGSGWGIAGLAIA